MNVAFDDWIPVVTIAGKRQLASLCEVLTNGRDYADLAVRPHERVALMRLFLCVVHAALDGPKDYDDWRQVPSPCPLRHGNIWRRGTMRSSCFNQRSPGCKWRRYPRVMANTNSVPICLVGRQSQS